MQREAGGTLHDQKAKFTLQAKEAEEQTQKAFFDNSMNSKLALNCFFLFFLFTSYAWISQCNLNLDSDIGIHKR